MREIYSEDVAKIIGNTEKQKLFQQDKAENQPSVGKRH